MSRVLQEIEGLASDRTNQLRRAKEEGRRVIQYTGSFIPDEVIRAAGAEPYPMCRGGELEPTEAILDDMLRFMNPLARSMAGFYKMGMDPVTPISDLIITHQNECHIGRITELLEAWGLPIAKVGVPADWERDFAFEYYCDGLKEMTAKIEEVTGNRVDEAALREHLSDTNRINAGLRRIDGLRKRDNPPIGGLEFIRLVHCSYMVEPKLMIQKLDELYEELRAAPGKFTPDTPRLLLFGHAVAIGDYTVLRVFEESGAVFVTEFLDEGIRPYKWDVDTEAGDPLLAFARSRYLEKPPVNIFQPSWKTRFDYTRRLMAEYRADGVVSYQLAFDEIYNMEFACLAKWLDELRAPLLKLESSYEYSGEAMASLTTRIESFVNLVKEAKSK